MKIPALACLAALLLAASPDAMSQTAVYCKTEAGQLALMSARVVVGVPQTPADLPPTAQLPFRAVSELFRVAQNETTNGYCTPFVQAWVYISKDAASIDAVSRIAAAATSDTWTAPNVTVARMFIGRTGNVLNLSGTASRVNVTVGQTLYYRIGKQIIKEGGVDPYVFSSRLSFVVPPPPVVTALPNLVPRPTLLSNTNRALFKPTGASIGVGGESFLRVPDRFCANIATAGTPGDCDDNQQCRRLSMSVTLSPVSYFSRNVGAAPAGQFSIALLRQEMVDGVPTNLVTVSSHGVKSLEVNADSPPFSFNPGRTATVFQFPDNPGSCFTQCDPRLAGCTPAYQELEYRVIVDGGNSSRGDVLESSEGDDEVSPMGSF